MNETLVAARVDRLPNSKMHRQWMLLFAMPLFFDSCDINTFASAAPALIRHWHIAINEIALITSASFMGMFFGATLGGLLSDRMGRRRSLIVFVLISSLGSLATALVPSVPWLFAARVVTGFGISAGMVTVMTYIAELFPARSRGTWQSWAMVINLCAIPLTNLVARLVVPFGPDGWRWVFVWGALGVAFPLIARRLPESPRWSARAGRIDEAQAALAAMEARVTAEGHTLVMPAAVARAPEPREPWTAMFNGVYRRRTLTLCAIWLLQTIGFYGFEAWVPTLLVHHGITIARSLTYFTLINVGAPLGALLAVYPADRFERKHLIAVVALLIACFGLLYGLSFEPVMIVAFGFAVGLLTQTFATLLYSYTPEQFPTGVRNSATGLTYGAGRVANVANAFVIAAIYTSYGYVTVFMYIAGAWFLTALITVLFGPRTTGRSLETLNPAVDPDADGASSLAPLADYPRR
ncbi:Niacin transporter NiaP [Paraburkholderia caribensis MBA4]|uniref:Niacin transporter NiaP n=1 Tax=Paraburkholderia caribensis MBA4 TaxID=1323664 RepID=A0A0P0RGN3_9BURK|nr:MFS transporter [Paraburkholderia caribensis]ALL67438.1 Niacin transporter NiaP [Paraburkholderia caribensis MBA4]